MSNMVKRILKKAPRYVTWKEKLQYEVRWYTYFTDKSTVRQNETICALFTSS